MTTLSTLQQNKANEVADAADQEGDPDQRDVPREGVALVGQVFVSFEHNVLRGRKSLWGSGGFLLTLAVELVLHFEHAILRPFDVFELSRQIGPHEQATEASSDNQVGHHRND